MKKNRNDLQKILGVAFALLIIGLVSPAYAGAPPEPVVKCYPITDGLIDPPPVILQDQFGTETVDPGIARAICEIAIKHGTEPLSTPKSGVLYPINGIINPPSVSLEDQFGREIVDPSAAMFLLVPASETLQRGEQIDNHLKFYPISGTIDPSPVNLVDKFGNEVVDPLMASFLAVPAIKNDEQDDIDNAQHYKCYTVRGTIDPPEDDVLEDQFGRHVVDPDQAAFFCTQANKQLVSPPPSDDVIGGKLIQIKATSLILANAQSFSWMIPVVLSVLGIGLILVRRK